MKSSQSLGAFFLLFLLAQKTQAIGLGDITVESFINDPLQATIEVLRPESLSETEVLIGLASSADFDRLGLERHYSLSVLSFKPNFANPARPIIEVLTREPVTEPYMSFLLELKWPEGRVLREYTVLLDLPPSNAIAAGTRTSVLANDPVVRRDAAGEYRVSPNDTLGAIAAAFKPSNITVDQMMLAIKAANPASFLRDNINGIRAGVLLTLPTDFSTIPDAKSASREVAAEWERWRSPSARGLRIVADNELLPVGDDGDGSTLSQNSETMSAVSAETAVPESTPTEGAGSDLAAIESRLVALSAQLTELQNVVTDKDQEIARLSAELAQRPLRISSSEVGMPADASVSTDVSPSEGTFSTIVSTGFWMIVLLVVGVLAWLSRKRLFSVAGSEDDELGPPVKSIMGSSLDELLPVPTGDSPSGSESARMASERGYGESLLTGYASDQSLADAVAEADIYVAYGRHQHALDTLEAASAAEPDNATGLLKMLDIYLSLDRVDEATELLSLIEATNATGALDAARSRIQAHATPLEGDAGGRELAGETTDDSHESTVTMDMSLDLEFQEAETTQPELGAGSAASSGDADDPAETALELALAYIDMGDKVGASELLQTALSAGDAAQRQRAQSLLESLE